MEAELKAACGIRMGSKRGGLSKTVLGTGFLLMGDPLLGGIGGTDTSVGPRSRLLTPIPLMGLDAGFDTWRMRTGRAMPS